MYFQFSTLLSSRHVSGILFEGEALNCFTNGSIFFRNIFDDDDDVIFEKVNDSMMYDKCIIRSK